MICKEPRWKRALKAVKRALSLKKRKKIGRPYNFRHLTARPSLDYSK
jgi:hypothetical protein